MAFPWSSHDRVIADMLTDNYKRFPRLRRLVDAETAAEAEPVAQPVSLHMGSALPVFEYLEDFPWTSKPAPWMPEFHVRTAFMLLSSPSAIVLRGCHCSGLTLSLSGCVSASVAAGVRRRSSPAPSMARSRWMPRRQGSAA